MIFRRRFKRGNNPRMPRERCKECEMIISNPKPQGKKCINEAAHKHAN